MDNAQSNSFHRFISQMDSILTRLRSMEGEWRFIDVALLFLRYAFVSKGRQQLLSHITVIEALLGEQKGGTSLLANRLALVLGKTKNERDEISRSFKKDIYDLRSILVHGKEELFDKNMLETHLRTARSLARRTLVWFLDYLAYVLDETQSGETFPTREELLTVLDPKSAESSERIKRLLNILPEDIPHPANWFDQDRRVNGKVNYPLHEVRSPLE